MPSEQLPLFPSRRTTSKRRARAQAARAPESTGTTAPLDARATLATAITAYHEQMRRMNWSRHTIQAFGGDLNLFRKYVGDDVPLSAITSITIQKFLDWLRYERGVPCKPKSYQRRLTTLKGFFAWLKQIQVIADDPAAPIAHIPVIPPLPDILHDDQIARLLEHARTLLRAQKSDARPLLLVTLLLSTGIKKSEAMAIRLRDLDTADPNNATVFIRYDDAKKRFKERKLKLAPEFVTTLPIYLEQYQPREHLFECTARNLEYVLADLAQATGLGKTLSFESLRWTCAVQDYKNGMPEDHIRQKLGLTTIAWEEDGERLRRLASKPL
ncbi:MAG: tyrosine-type recombinase/integrase [Anaerolineae bacterium]|nr:tyrosine-type recombinase/integrase [Anaerolineae bacterium]